MVNLKVTALTIAGRRFNTSKVDYPSRPTVYSGAEVTWGAGSGIEHPEPSRAALSLWIPKSHENYIPNLGDEVSIRGGAEVAGTVTTNDTVDIFTGKVESVKVQDDHIPFEGYVAPTTIQHVSAVTNSASGTDAVAAGWTLTYVPNNVSTSLAPYTSINSGVFTVKKPAGAATSPYYIYTPTVPVASDKKIVISHGVPNSRIYTFQTRANGTNVLTDYSQFTDKYGNLTIMPEPETTHFRFGWAANFVADTAESGQITATVGPFSALQEGPNTVATDPSGYRVNLVASDALAEGGRLRLSSEPWAATNVQGRVWQVSEAAKAAGVQFADYVTTDQGAADTTGVYVIPRDVDSAPALEVYQKAVMAAGLTVISAKNIIQPSVKLKLPRVLSMDSSAASAVYSWTGSRYVSPSILKVNGVQTRRNEARYPVSPSYTTTEWSTVAGTSGVVSTSNSSMSNSGVDRAPGTAWNTYMSFSKQWTTGATGGSHGILYKDTAITGTSSSRLSAGIWVMPSATKNMRLVLTAKNGTTPVGTVSGPVVSAKGGVWTWLKAEGVTTTNSYTSVEALAEVQTTTNMQTNDVLAAQGVIIEKTATMVGYFDGSTTDASTTTVMTDVTVGPNNDALPLVPASAIEDDAFEIDTTEVVTQVKISYRQEYWDTANNKWAFEEESADVNNFAGLPKTTPQERSLDSDLLVLDGTAVENTFLFQKAQTLLAAQSTPQYRLSGGVRIVLKALPEQVSLKHLLNEATRFGHLIKLSGQSNLLSPYFRVKAGRFLFGDEPAMEFEIEPVEYSAPTPMSQNTLFSDTTVWTVRLHNLKTLTSDDLRQVGAR